MRRLFFFGLIFLLAALFFERYRQRFWNPDLRITFFDVGQGDSILIQFPFGKTLLIDAGGGFEKWNLGQKELYLELARLGILSLDAGLLTHPDRDHAEGFKGLFPQIGIRQLWMNAIFMDEKRKPKILTEILDQARKQNTALIPFRKRHSFPFSGTQLTLFTPAQAKDSNNRSLVLQLEFGKCRFLFPGDLEAKGERELATSLLSPIDVLKVGHHGSHSSTLPAWLARLRPKLSVISSGAGNLYGHPHREPLSRLRAARSEILRTDFHGFIRLTTTKEGKGTCESYQGPCGTFSCGR